MVRGSIVLALTAAAVAGPASAETAAPPGRLGTPTAEIRFGTFVSQLAVAPGGRVVLAGSSGTGGAGTRRTFVRALTPGLEPDPAFGAGGEVSFDYDLRDPTALAVEPDGQMLLVRSSIGPSPAPLRLYRLNADGSPDESFGSGGSTDIAFDGNPVYSPSLALYPDGRILVAGRPSPRDGEPPSRVHLYRFLPNGSPDPTFGSQGHVEQVAFDPGASAMVARQPGRGIVLVVPAVDPAFWIMRFTESGRPDLGFGRGGLAGVELADPRWEAHVHPAGTPLVTRAGRIRIPVTFGERESVMRFGIVGLTPNGKVDRRFGRRGLALGPRQPYEEGGEAAGMAVLDPRGSILMAGSISHADDLSGDDASIVRRFRPNGALDRSFGRRGVMRVASPGGVGLHQLLASFDDDTGLLVAQEALSRYGTWGGGVLRPFSAGYDRTEPAVSIRSGCRWMRVKIRDTSALDGVVLRVNGRVARRTKRESLRIRVRPGLRISVTAVDVAGNPARVRTTVPPC